MWWSPFPRRNHRFVSDCHPPPTRSTLHSMSTVSRPIGLRGCIKTFKPFVTSAEKLPSEAPNICFHGRKHLGQVRTCFSRSSEAFPSSFWWSWAAASAAQTELSTSFTRRFDRSAPSRDWGRSGPIWEPLSLNCPPCGS